MKTPRKPGRPSFSVARFSGDHDKESRDALRYICETYRMRPVEVLREALTRWARDIKEAPEPTAKQRRALATKLMLDRDALLTAAASNRRAAFHSKADRQEAEAAALSIRIAELLSP
jgi:hypothetical protein